MYFPIFRANVAVLGILRAARLEPNARMDMAEFRSEWSQLSLRRRDLQRSLQRLESLGFVEIDRARGHEYVVLTEMGHRSAHSLVGRLESLLVLHGRTRPPSPRPTHRAAGDAPRRRARDRRRKPAL